MPIAQRQIDELSRRFLMEGLREGKHLSPHRLAEKVEDFLQGRPERGPVMRVRAQGKKRRWDLDKQNRTMEELDLDLEVLFAEMLSLSRSVLRRHNFTEVAYHAQSRDLDIITGELTNLLFVTRNTNDRFYGVFDNFRDLSKVDVDLSTPDVVDLAESVLILPAGALSTRKVNLSHLHDLATWRVGITAAGNVKESVTPTDAPFGNAFHDLVNAWRHDVTTDAPGPVSVELTIPVSGIETQEVSISRVQLISHSPKPTQALVTYSTDNVNYLKIPQGSSVIMGRSDQEYNLDTEPIRVQYLRVVLTKQEADTENPDGTYGYFFGLKHLGLYSVGRSLQADMVSKALSPGGMTDDISRVSLQTVVNTPVGTSVSWYIKAIDVDGEEVSGWRPISPLNATSPDLPTVLRFGNEEDVTIRLLGAGATSWSTFRNAVVYSLAGSALPAGETSIDVAYGTARLFRGLGAWSRNRKTERRVKRVQDSYISFDTGLRQSIWTNVTESAVASTRRTDSLDQDTTHLVVTNLIDYDVQTMRPTRDENVNAFNDPTPRYAIHSILWHRSKQSETETLTVSDIANPWAPWVKVSSLNVLIERGVNEPVLTNVAGSVTYQRDRDYSLGYKGDDLYVTLIPGGVGLSIFPGTGSVDFKITYKLNPDITRLVHAINENTIVLRDDLQQGADETFEVTYRFIPIGSHKIVKPTIKVTSKRGADEGVTYREGPDYTIDVDRGTITRIASGAIQPDGENLTVYMDFFYETPASLLETFTIWVFSEEREPKRIQFADQSLDAEAGEHFYIRTAGQVVDLTRSEETPLIGYGWHQIVVQSKDPDEFNNAAIRKIAALKDKDDNPVFLSGGRYFSRVMATRQPMKQVEENYLLTNIVPANHENFALTSAGEVLVNFLPGTTTDLYTYALRVEDGGTTTFLERDEELEIVYTRRISDATPIRSIRVRAFLSRVASASGAITPKVHGYDVKIG